MVLKLVSRSVLSVKSSLATAELFTSDKGCTEESQRQILTTCNVILLEIIEVFVNNKIDNNFHPQQIWICPKESVCQKTVENRADDVAYALIGHDKFQI